MNKKSSVVRSSFAVKFPRPFSRKRIMLTTTLRGAKV